MNDDFFKQTKARMEEALKQTQAQTEDAATKLGPLLRKGAEKLKEAADAAGRAIRDDINRRP
jgi:hypothetical protein